MKILHMISQTPDFTGSGKYICQLLKQSSGRGHENALVAGAPKEFEFIQDWVPSQWCSFVRFDGQNLEFPIPGMSDTMPYPSSRFSRLSQSDLIAYKKAFEQTISIAIKKFKPDIIHTHHLWILTSIARKVAPNIPIVTSCHGTCLRQHELCPDISNQIKGALEKVDLIIALSNDQKKKIETVFNVDSNSVKVIPGGFNPDLFHFEPKLSGKRVELLYAGKLSAAKGVPWLINSLKQLKDIPFLLHLAGTSSGEEKETCLSLAGTLEEKAVCHGHISHEKLAQLMKRSHIFVLPSFYEGVPLVLMEALACGCRIVATDLPGVKEIFGSLSSDMICLVKLPELETIDRPFKKDEPGLEKQLAACLKEQIHQAEQLEQLNFSSVQAITQKYTWESIFSQIKAVYHQVLRKQS